MGAVLEDWQEEVASKAALQDGAGLWAPLCLYRCVSTAQCSGQVTLGHDTELLWTSVSVYFVQRAHQCLAFLELCICEV